MITNIHSAATFVGTLGTDEPLVQISNSGKTVFLSTTETNPSLRTTVAVTASASKANAASPNGKTLMRVTTKVVKPAVLANGVIVPNKVTLIEEIHPDSLSSSEILRALGMELLQTNDLDGARKFSTTL